MYVHLSLHYTVSYLVVISMSINITLIQNSEENILSHAEQITGSGFWHATEVSQITLPVIWTWIQHTSRVWGHRANAIPSPQSSSHCPFKCMDCQQMLYKYCKKEFPTSSCVLTMASTLGWSDVQSMHGSLKAERQGSRPSTYCFNWKFSLFHPSRYFHSF